MRMIFICSFFIALCGCDLFNQQRAAPVWAQEIVFSNQNLDYKNYKFQTEFSIRNKDRYYFELRYQVYGKKDRELVLNKFDINNNLPKANIKIINESGSTVYASNEKVELYLLAENDLIIDLSGNKGVYLKKGKYFLMLEFDNSHLFNELSSLHTSFEVSNAARGK